MEGGIAGAHDQGSSQEVAEPFCVAACGHSQGLLGSVSVFPHVSRVTLCQLLLPPQESATHSYNKAQDEKHIPIFPFNFPV